MVVIINAIFAIIIIDIAIYNWYSYFYNISVITVLYKTIITRSNECIYAITVTTVISNGTIISLTIIVTVITVLMKTIVTSIIFTATFVIFMRFIIAIVTITIKYICYNCVI